MKNLTLIVHEDVKEGLADALRALPQIREFIVTPVQSHGARDNSDAFLSMRDQVAGYTPQIRVDLMLEDGNDSQEILSALHGIAGRGVYWVTQIKQFGRLG